MAINAEEDDKRVIQNLLDIYDNKILPIGIGTKGNKDEIVDIVSDYCWTAQQFDQRNTSSNSVTYSHNIPFCYAIEREQTIGSGAANILNTILGAGQALAGVGDQALTELGKKIDRVIPQKPEVKSQDSVNNPQPTSSSISNNPVLIKSNTFPNIIMPATGNEQSQLQNNNGIATIDTAPSWGHLGDDGAPREGVVLPGGKLMAVRSDGKLIPVTADQIGVTPGANNSPNEQPANAQGQDGDISKPNNSATSNNGEQNGSQTSTFASMAKAFQASTNTLLSALKVLGNKFANEIDKNGRLQESNLNSSLFLKPWKWLYFTRPTSKKFVFPMLKANDLHRVTNQWGNGESTGKFAGFFDKISEWLKQGSETAKGFRDFAYFFPAEGEARSYENLEIEKAMGYQYSGQGGPDVKVEFVLYNTTKKDAWKKNFRFILLFAMRNMAFRTSIYSYKAPLLYDIIIPGVKHLPMCYVANFDITALGHVRNMTTDNIIAEIVSNAASATTLIPVPEAWQIGITFKCMIPNTSNLILDLASFPINVTTVDRSEINSQTIIGTNTNIVATEMSGVNAIIGKTA